MIILLSDNITVSGFGETQNYGFILFLFCFFVFAYQISYRNKLISDLFKSVFRGRSRDRIFKENIGNETADRMLFCFQGLLLLSVVIFRVVSHDVPPESLTATDMFGRLLHIFCILSIFVLIKLLLVVIVGAVFFSGKQVGLWNKDFLSIICLEGVVSFLPAVFIFYVEEMYAPCLIFMAAVQIIAFFAIVFRLFATFFNKAVLLFYFILYLCTIEFVPFYLLYEVIKRVC
ncbi:MAG: DUF4271 domain-containing protein [Dysgonamonadaceae bacterium]|jgi:hypothetical protein|nr:DUF4271 domain-containing protein [Dysgonamonadaceae bacterium]